MKLEELRKLIATGEGEMLEFKATTGQREDACETLCGYLNKDGGTVIFGVTRKGELTGQLVSDKTKRELFEVFAKFEPSADIAVDWVDVDVTHQAIVCTVPRGNERPYVYDGRPYKRVQSSTALDLEHLYNPPVCDSRPRNPRIARVLYLCKMIETWGRGLGVIAGECKRAGLALPATAMRWGFVVTTFKRPRIDESGSNLDQNLDHADPDPIQIDPDAGGDIPRRLLSTLRKNPLISRKLLADELNVSERKIRDSLKILKDSGVIVRQGPDHGGIWRISHIVAKTKRHDTIKPHHNEPVNEPVNEPINGRPDTIKSADDTINGTMNRHDEVVNGSNEVVNEVVSGHREVVNKAVNEVVKTVLEAIKTKPGIKKPELQTITGKSHATIERAVDLLKKLSEIEYRGSDKTGGYYAVK